MAFQEKHNGKYVWVGQRDMRHKGGQRFKRRYETEAKAKAFEAWIDAHGEPPPGDQDIDGMAFGELAKKAEVHGGPTGKWKRGRSGSDANRRKWVADRFAKVPVDQVDTEKLDALVLDLERRPGNDAEYLDNDTIDKYLAAVSGILRFGFERKLIKSMPHIPWLPKTGGRIHWLNEDQEQAVVDWLRDQGHLPAAVVVRVLCVSGLRWGEFAGLKPTDIVPAGDGAHDFLVLDHTKTDVPRRVPIPTRMADELRAMLRTNKRPRYAVMRSSLKRLLPGVGKSAYAPLLPTHNCYATCLA